MNYVQVDEDDYIVGQWLTTGPEVESSLTAYGDLRGKRWCLVGTSRHRASGHFVVSRSSLPPETQSSEVWRVCQAEVDGLLQNGQRFCLALQVEGKPSRLTELQASTAHVWEAMQNAAAAQG